MILVLGNVHKGDETKPMEQQSILTSTKKLLGIQEEYEHFDTDIIIYINSALSILTQLGIGPPTGFIVSDKSATWDNFTSDDKKISLIKPYVLNKVKMMFDPPQSSAAVEATNKITAELEWRIMADAGKEEDINVAI